MLKLVQEGSGKFDLAGGVSGEVSCGQVFLFQSSGGGMATGAEPLLTTAMKSVGEAMSIGRTFQESLQKALRSMETGLTGLNEIEIKGAPDKSAIVGALARPTPDRILVIAQAFRHGLSVEEIAQASKFEPWFLRQIKDIIDIEMVLDDQQLADLDAARLRELKRKGFSDRRLAKLLKSTESEVRQRRRDQLEPFDEQLVQRELRPLVAALNV